VIGTRRGSALKALSTIAFATLAIIDATWAAAAVSGRPNIDRIGREGVMFMVTHLRPKHRQLAAIFTADNGVEHSGRTHGGTAPFRSEKK
jgi:hypothetical protein